MAKTSNLGLYICTDDELVSDNITVADWRKQINGNGTGTTDNPYSAFQLIDAKLGSLNDLNQVDDKIKHIHGQGNASTAVWIRLAKCGTEGGKVNITGSFGTYESDAGAAHISALFNTRSGNAVFGSVQTINFNTACDRIDFGIDNNQYVWMKLNNWYCYDLLITLNDAAEFVEQTSSSTAPSWVMSTGYTSGYSKLIIN